MAKFICRTGPPTGLKTIPSRRFHAKQISNMAPTSQVAKLELTHENYECYVLLLLFDAFYLAWLKDCSSSTYLADFNVRQEHLKVSLESAFPEYSGFKRRIGQMAKRNAFLLLRKLKVTIEEVRKCSDSTKHRVTNKCLRVRIRTRNMAADGVEFVYYANYPILLRTNYTMTLDFPIELNDTNTKVSIEFILVDYSSEETTVKPESIDDEMLAEKETLLQVQEVHISGFTGYNTKCTIVDETIKEAVELKFSFSWDLNLKSIQEQIKWGNIVASHFSVALLALGAYFWRFFGSLYTALLLHKDTEMESVKVLNEVAFILNNTQKASLLKPLLALLDKRVGTFELSHGGIECFPDECDLQFRLLHGAFLILEHLPVDDQNDLMERLRSGAFAHLLRFQCEATPMKRMLQLQRMALRRLLVVSKKAKHRTMAKTEPFLEYTLEVLIDIVKQERVAEVQSEEELTEMQDSAVKIFAKFYALAEEGKEVTSKVTDDSEDSGDQYSSAEETESETESETASSETKATDINLSPHWSPICQSYEYPLSTVTASSIAAVSSDDHMKDIAFELAYAHFAHNPLQQLDCALLYSMLPASIVERLVGEGVLTSEYYEPMLVLVRQIAQQIVVAKAE